MTPQFFISRVLGKISSVRPNMISRLLNHNDNLSFRLVIPETNVLDLRQLYYLAPNIKIFRK